jgi:excinuclease ABC subunit A
VVIEHNLDVIKTADWIIDLGPEGGERGGLVIAEGTPEELAIDPASATGSELARVLAKGGVHVGRRRRQGASVNGTRQVVKPSSRTAKVTKSVSKTRAVAKTTAGAAKVGTARVASKSVAPVRKSRARSDAGLR